MKNPVVIAIIAIVFLGVIVFVSTQSDSPSGTVPNQINTQGTETIPPVNEQPATMPNTRGSYEAYAADKLARADSGDVVLFFRASWCPTCRTLDADIKKNMNSIPSGVTILDVNFDDSTALKQKHGVTYQHTLVQVDSDGAQIAKWTGTQTLQELLAQIR